MRNFFAERTNAKRQVLEVHQTYRRQFYHADCLWDSRKEVLQRSEAERFVGSSLSETGAIVVTSGAGLARERYHLGAGGRNWMIDKVQMECAWCRGRGIFKDCKFCDGSGWQSREHMSNLMRQFRPGHSDTPGSRIGRPRPPSVEEETASASQPDPPVEQFMLDHFRARTASYQKQSDIFGTFARRFYNPDYDWTRLMPAVADSQKEEIASVERLAEEVRVITRNFQIFRLRYQLRPAGKSWLIWAVDTECPVCFQQGQSANCNWCGGTVWEKVKGSSQSRA